MLQVAQIAPIQEHCTYIQGTAPPGTALWIAWPQPECVSWTVANGDGIWEVYVPEEVVLWQGQKVRVSTQDKVEIAAQEVAGT